MANLQEVWYNTHYSKLKVQVSSIIADKETLNLNEKKGKRKERKEKHRYARNVYAIILMWLQDHVV